MTDLALGVNLHKIQQKKIFILTIKLRQLNVDLTFEFESETLEFKPFLRISRDVKRIKNDKIAPFERSVA